MSNFSSSFTGGSWSRRPSGDSQRRSGKSLPQAPGHRHHTAGGGGADGGGGRRQATGQWGRRQFNGGGTKCAAGVEPAQTEPTTTNIKDLYPHQPNTVIVGIVVGKFSINSFPDKRNPGTNRFKFTFTLRDSPSDYINATCWGSEEYIKKLHSSFKICDVVELQNGQVLSKASSDVEDKWRPWTPSQYQINVSELYSTLTLYDGGNYTDFTALAHIPLRPPNDYYTLSDVLSSGQSLDASYVNILAIVKHVGAPREMTSRYGKPLKKCEVVLMDDGCAGFSLVLWDEELIELAQSWTPKENIIFAVDVRVTFDTYRNCMIATCNQKSIITTNPDCREAHQLYQYGQTVELGPAHSVDDFNTTGVFNSSQESLQSISQVFTVDQLLDQQSSGSSTQPLRDGPINTFSGILFAFLTCLEIDGSLSTAVCYRCVSCHFKAEKEATQCSNKNCSSLNFAVELHYNLFISLSDHTGGVAGVRLQGQPACDLLKSTPQEFLGKSEKERTELKSSLLLERFKVVFRSGVKVQEKRPPLVRVLAMSPADPDKAMVHVGAM